MKQINDFFTILNSHLSQDAIVKQCIIKDYVVSQEEGKEGLAFCTAIIPSTNNAGVVEITNVHCFVGGSIDITYQDYMHGILIKLQAPYTKAQDISTKVLQKEYSYFHFAVDGYIAIILPHAETISNLLTAKLTAKDKVEIKSEFIGMQANQIYVGNKETNVLNELSEYLMQLKDFFTQLAQYAPTFSQLPANGSAQTVTLSTQMATKTDEVYQKVTKIVNTKMEDDENNQS